MRLPVQLPPDASQHVLQDVLNRLSVRYEPYAVTESITLTDRDEIDSVQVDTTGGAITVTLPESPTGNRRRRVTKTDSSTNAVTVSGNGNLINGVSTYILRYPNESVTVEPTGVGWVVVFPHDGQPHNWMNVKWFGAVGDGATDDTTAINNTITAANTIASVIAKQIRVIFPNGTYLTDGILIKSNVWLDMGGAQIKKRSDGVSAATNSLIRAIETLSGGTYYGTYENIKITGGFLYGNGKTASANMIRLLFIEGLVVDGVTVSEYTAGQWAFALGGNDIQVRSCRTIGGDALTEDGIHVMFGERISIADCDIESGDDAIALGGETSDAFQAADPFPLRGVSVANCTVKSQLATAVKIYVPSTGTGVDWEVSDINIVNISGRAGITRNGGIAVYDLNAGALGASQISRVNISNVSLDVGSTTHNETNPYGIWLSSVDDVTLANIIMKLTDKTTPTTGFQLCYVTNCENIELNNLRCDALARRSGIIADDTNHLRIRGGYLKATTAMVAGSPIKLEDVVNTDIDGMTILDANDAGYGIEISAGTTTSARIRGCRIAQVGGAATGSGIVVVSTTFTRLTITDNDFTGCVAAINGGSLSAGASYLCADNINFVSKSQGTATVANGTTSIAVTHGLALTPGNANIQVVPTNNLGAATKFWISAPGATQFTINVDADPGATTATFAWFADVGKKPL